MQLNMYNTDQTLDMNNLQVTCLHYYNGLYHRITYKMEYCLGPLDDNNYSFNNVLLHTNGEYLTFDQLRQLNVTINDLLSWSATIDLTEQYQDYLDHQHNSSLLTEVFFNCTKPWFGPRCQFSFVLNTASLFEEFIFDALYERLAYTSPYNITNLTCYAHLKCDRGGSSMCLDWREICDGRIDCINGGIDEEQCFDLEVNECNEDEYRCHNGQCIPKEFLKAQTIECLDQSDSQHVQYGDFFPTDALSHFLYEEHSCRRGSEQFVCGDGNCVADFNECKNKRHLLLIESISTQGNLSDSCWMMMVCLTKILGQLNQTLCHQILTSSHINTYLKNCDDVIQFPIIPVLFGHIRFLYRPKAVNDWDIDSVLIPDYICYDDKLCDFLIPTYHHGNYSCRHRYQFNFDSNINYKKWSLFIQLVEAYFRKCSVRYNKNNIKNGTDFPSLYCCTNSSKCISKHRILDNVSDCYLNDDEEQYELSCSIDDVLRFRCINQNKCYSSIVRLNICPQSNLRRFDKMRFQDFCDQHVQMFTLEINEKNHTDETDCEDWPCNNFYTRCDGFWSCPNGEDEDNCTKQICPSHFFPCVNPNNYTFRCLPANQVNDGKIDCLGALDERQHCRNCLYLMEGDCKFRCWNDDKCTSRDNLCNNYAECPGEDDEKFCEHQHADGLCSLMGIVNLTDIENAICLTVYMEKLHFSLETSAIYPALDIRTNEQPAQQSLQQRNIPRLIINEIDDPAWFWRCNHGLYVRHWSGNNQLTYKCFCPPSYYGNRCQYQNQRVTLTIQMREIYTNTVYAVIISLIDDNDYRQQIISYQQFTTVFFMSCSNDFNGYLTYDTRPKNSSTNYAIRIDVYNKNSLTYLASWHYTVPFSFLPVNRMAVVLYVSFQQVPAVSSCSLRCQNGTCMKYMNKEKFYCHCYAGWSGIECDIPIRCSDCSSDSTCVGMIHNRSIYVCPLNKAGPRCLLTLSCRDVYCENNGTCVVFNDGMHENSFRCICPKGIYGLRCEKSIWTLDIVIHNIKISSILLIYSFYLDIINYEHLLVGTITVQKLTIFQRTVSLITKDRISMILVKTDDNYYLAVLQHTGQENISTSIDPSRRCASVTEFFTIEQRNWPEIRRVKYYHKICQTHLDIMCFVDDPYICLCTLEHHANCFRFDSTPPKCRDKFYCRNGGTCLQDDVQCPSTRMCNCAGCYFGDRCQYYAKGIGLTLDDILRYELRPNITLSHQSSIIKWSCGLTMIIFVGGLINSILSLLTFTTKQSRENGCGLYLLASSITSLLTVSLFTAKFWFLILTQINPSVSQSVLRGGCISFEFMLKGCLYMDNWLNACVALERMVAVYKGVNFNKMSSKQFARWIIFILSLLIIISVLHEPLNRDLFDDKDEQRFWCVFYYSSLVGIYNTVIIYIHFIGPFCANLFSAFFIIFVTARQRVAIQNRLTYTEHLYNQFKELKNLIISPIILIILSILGVIISLSSDCVKVSYNAWFYLFGYLISFVPSMSIFIVFVLPSEYYKKQFKERIKFGRR